MKPLGKKSYGSIPHLFGSKLGEGDHHCHEGLPLLAQPARINSTRPKLCASAESTSWRMNLAAIFSTHLRCSLVNPERFRDRHFTRLSFGEGGYRALISEKSAFAYSYANWWTRH